MKTLSSLELKGSSTLPMLPHERNERSNLLLQRLIEQRSSAKNEEPSKPCFGSLESAEVKRKKAKLSTWVSSPKPKGSMFCVELWSARQVKDAQISARLYNSISSAHKKPTKETVPEDSNKNFLNRYPEYAYGTELVKLLTQSDETDRPSLAELDLFPDVKRKDTRRETKKLSIALDKIQQTECNENDTSLGSPQMRAVVSERRSFGGEFSPHLETIFRGTPPRLATETSSGLSPVKVHRKIRESFTMLNLANGCENRTSDSTPLSLTPLHRPSYNTVEKKKQKDFIIKGRFKSTSPTFKK